MAIGDASDVQRRLNALVPGSWFKGEPPEIEALLSGIADAQSAIYSLVGYAKDQARIQTSTDGFAELAAYDFFGLGFPRLAGEADAAYTQRIILEIFRERATRKGIAKALTDLTGFSPVIAEPANPGDTFAWDVSCWDEANWGSIQNNNQIFVIAYRPKGGGIANIPGWDAGYWDKTVFWVDQTMIVAQVTDAQIYATVAKTVAAGVTAWVMITNHP